MSGSRSYEVPASRCPGCGLPLDCATGHATPEPGDLSVCLECGLPCRFDHALTLVTLTDAELGALPPEFLTEQEAARFAVLRANIAYPNLKPGTHAPKTGDMPT
jgi:hypothetical protein